MVGLGMREYAQRTADCAFAEERAGRSDIFVFFSSRRRHTRYWRDWSSDVCSSDLSSCAQHQIADVGIEGVLKKHEGEFVEAMDIRIGGRLGEDAKFGDVVIRKVPHWELNETLLRIFTLYEIGRAHV